MNPAVHNIDIYQGATWHREMAFKIDGAVVNLSSYKCRMTIRRTYGSAAILALSSEGVNPAIVLSAANPNIIVTITATQTAALNFGYAIYDLEIESVSGTVDQLMRGRVTLNPEATT